MGARRLVLTVRRVDGAAQRAEIGLARPGRDPMRLRALFEPKVAEIEAGFGIDALRLAAARRPRPCARRNSPRQHRETEAARLADLISRLGNRVGFERVTRPSARRQPHPRARHHPRRCGAFRSRRLERHPRHAPAAAHHALSAGTHHCAARGGLPEHFTWRGQRLTTRSRTGPRTPRTGVVVGTIRTGAPALETTGASPPRKAPASGSSVTPAAQRPAWYAHGAFA